MEKLSFMENPKLERSRYKTLVMLPRLSATELLILDLTFEGMYIVGGLDTVAELNNSIKETKDANNRD